MLPDIYLNAGKTAYEKGNYKEAYTNFKKAVHLSNKNQDARYYYVQTLIKLAPTLEIQKEIFSISQDNFPDSADLIADEQISKWRNVIVSNIGTNYIEQAPYNNSILRWDVDKFPIKVSIENLSDKQLPAYYREKIEQSFVQWQKATGDFIRFKLIDNPQDADIVVKIAPQTTKDCQGDKCQYVAASTSPSVSGDLLKRMDITIFDSNNLGKPFSERELYNTSLHEIGHALGIMGHSYNKNDLMYMEESSGKGSFDIPQHNLQFISSSDLNTISLLYKLIPNITNTPLSKFDTSRQFFSPIVMGNKEEINSKKLQEALNYINAAPNLPNGYIDLSAAYTELKEYGSAMESLNKALERSSNDNEKFIVYYNMSVLYMNLRDWDNSLKFAQMAKDVQPQSGSDIDGLIAGINFNKGNKAFAKQTYIDTLEKQPGSLIDAINLSRIYLKELNLIQAGKVLNRLVKANPEAKNDPRIKASGLLMFFFR